MTHSLTIIIIDKNALLKALTVKDYKPDELFKKCGFKKQEGFNLQIEWQVKLNGTKYLIQMYGKSDGKANTENKYDFPPPVDKKLYFGSCCLIGMIIDNSNKTYINLSVELWNKIYEKLFGGFEDLTLTCNEDETEEDELEYIQTQMKTKKGGYLKDGFVVDSSDAEEDIDTNDYETESFSDDDENETNKLKIVKKGEEDTEDIVIEDIGSELSEESYDYDSEGSK